MKDYSDYGPVAFKRSILGYGLMDRDRDRERENGTHTHYQHTKWKELSILKEFQNFKYSLFITVTIIFSFSFYSFQIWEQTGNLIFLEVHCTRTPRTWLQKVLITLGPSFLSSLLKQKTGWIGMENNAYISYTLHYYSTKSHIKTHI